MIKIIVHKRKHFRKNSQSKFIYILSEFEFVKFIAQRNIFYSLSLLYFFTFFRKRFFFVFVLRIKLYLYKKIELKISYSYIANKKFISNTYTLPCRSSTKLTSFAYC